MYPIFFKLGQIHITSYMVFVGLGIVVAILVGLAEARRLDEPFTNVYDFSFWMIVSFLCGSYLMYVFFHLRYYLADPLKILDIWRGGLVYQGGMITALIVAFYYTRRYSLRWRLYMDGMALALPLGQCLGRIGCFLTGCCFGQPTSMPWGVTHTSPYTTAPKHTPLHPVQLYEAILLGGICAVCLYLRRRKRFDGQIMLTYLCLTGFARFGTEFFRSPLDYRGPVWGEMPLTQAMAIVIALAAMGVIWWLYPTNDSQHKIQ